MLRDITIKNYRAFKDFSMDGLARVNLIVGSNNAGKTSFLEAVYLLLGKDNRSALPQLLQARREYSENATNPETIEYRFPTMHLFNGHKPIAGPKRLDDDSIIIRSSHDRSIVVRISVKDSDSQTTLFNELNKPQLSNLKSSKFGHSVSQLMALQNQLYPYELQLSYDTTIVSYPVDNNALFHFNSFRFDNATNSLSYLTPRNDDIVTVAQLWEGVTISLEKEDAVIDALKILDKDVRDIRLSSSTSERGFLIGRLGERNRIPLTSMGDGMRRILTLCTAAIVTKDRALFIDEIDTGLHYRAQADVWQLLFRIAKERDIQIFATTHSRDCVEAFQEALAEDDNAEQGYLFRLQRRGDAIYPVGYTSDDLDVAVGHAIEVR